MIDLPPFEGGLDPNVRLYAQAARLARFGAWECDLVTERLSWTEGVYDLFGLSPGVPLRRTAIVGLYAEKSRAAMEAMRASVIESGESLTFDAEIRTLRGETRWMRLSIDVATVDGRRTRLFGAKQDVTGERAMLDRLRQMAERDPVTGLVNRAVFEKHYRAIVADRLDHCGVAALVLVDSDLFKLVNDRLGHGAGDECLRETARRLQRIFADRAMIARIGGDEFAVLLRAPLEASRLRQILQQACNVLCRPVAFGEALIDIGVSIGASILCRPHVRASIDPFGEADSALDVAKAAGRGTVHVFGDDPRTARRGAAAVRQAYRRS